MHLLITKTLDRYGSLRESLSNGAARMGNALTRLRNSKVHGLALMVGMPGILLLRLSVALAVVIAINPIQARNSEAQRWP